MIADVYTVRQAGILIPERDSRGQVPLHGNLCLQTHWISETRSKPALILHETSNVTAAAIKAILFEPKLVHMGDAWMRFQGWEVLEQPGQGRQIVLQEWRCLLK